MVSDERLEQLIGLASYRSDTPDFADALRELARVREAVKDCKKNPSTSTTIDDQGDTYDATDMDNYYLDGFEEAIDRIDAAMREPGK